MRKLIFDVETNGLLPTMDRIHCLVARDPDTRQTWRFRRHEGGYINVRPLALNGPDTGQIITPQNLEPEDTIAEGIELAEKADMLIGHNIMNFDLHAIRLIFPDFKPKGIIRDTLVLSRLIAPDTKEGDWKLVKQKRFPAQLVGSHSLDAWGYRVGKHKGDYSKQMLKLGLDPWAHWNMDQEDYCENDIDVNEILWAAISAEMPPDTAVELEHQVHDICGVMERNGYFFDKEGAEALAEELETELESLSVDVRKRFGYWYAPAKKYPVRAAWDDPKGINRAKKYNPPREEWGEDYSRAIWADITFPKKSMRSSNPAIRGDKTEGCPYCAIKKVEFNPGSRHHIIDRFTTVYGWVPVDFNDETGSVICDDAVLNKLAETIPEAKPLAEIAFYKKLLGQLKNGGESWLNNVKDDGRIHPYINCGGTVTGRGSHSHPNIGQVVAVLSKKGPNGEKIILMKREGDYGWECRSLFYTPATIIQIDEDGNEVEEEWVQVGVDLVGIEFRCLGEVCAEFDGGKLIEVCTSGKDVHGYHMDLAGLDDRDITKRGTYGLMYGAGDWKLGHTIAPYATDDEKRRIGANFRAVLMAGVPALNKAIQKIHAEAERGYLIGLDGRKIGVRAVYSSLNTRLQSDAALIAKKWLVLAEQYLLEAGLDHGWCGDFAMLTWVHDEIQIACKKKYKDLVASEVVRAANDAGVYFNRKCPVDADFKIGHNWAECH